MNRTQIKICLIRINKYNNNKKVLNWNKKRKINNKIKIRLNCLMVMLMKKLKINNKRIVLNKIKKINKNSIVNN